MTTRNGCTHDCILTDCYPQGIQSYCANCGTKLGETMGLIRGIDDEDVRMEFPIPSDNPTEEELEEWDEDEDEEFEREWDEDLDEDDDDEEWDEDEEEEELE